MKTLIILRHAKSDWSSDDIADFDRPLNQKGRKDAPSIGRLLAHKQITPQRVLCSTSLRTRQTWELVLSAMERERKVDKFPVDYLEEIYQADLKTLIESITEQSDTFSCLLIVAHNPGCELLLHHLTNVHQEMKPGNAAILSFNGDSWYEGLASGVTWSSVDFLTP